jgi:pimeloyl-ACP methyl ester carboxylesterase
VALVGGIVAGGALVVTASSVLATPQPLESALEGQGRIFRFREGDVFYKVRGPADAQPVLLLHSLHLSASSFEWRKNFDALSHNFRVYAPDLLGFGLSDRPAIDYSAALYVNLITDFAREVIGQPAIVVARDQSAAFTVRAAYLDSQLFNRLVFISPNGIIPSSAESRAWLARSGAALQGVLRRLNDTPVGQTPYAFLTTKPALAWLIARQSYANPEHVTPEVVQYMFATTHQYGARFAPLAFMSGKLDIDVAGDFTALRQPILLVWGEQDAINDPSHAEALRRLNQHTRLELIEQAGNAVQEEQAAEVNELLRAWFMAPKELADPTLQEQPVLAAAPTAAPEAQITPPATTAAPLITPAPEEAMAEEGAVPGTPTTQAELAASAALETEAPIETSVSEIIITPGEPTVEVAAPAAGAGAEAPPAAAEEEAPAYVEAPADEAQGVATPPAASPAAAPEPFATADTKMPSATPEEASPEAAAAPPPESAAPSAPETSGAAAETSDVLAQTEAQAAPETLEQAPAAPAPPGGPSEEPAAPEPSAPETATPQQPAREAQRRPATKPSGARPGAPGQVRPGKAAQQPSQRTGARQARPDSGDKPQPPRPSGGARKKK